MTNSSSYHEEIPITSTPIFEGHLYIRTIKKQWQWRLFRFDGSSFTCLSTKKVKILPPSIQDAPLLLMTPKDKDKRMIKDEKLEVKYYQLPEWTIDISHISSITILKRKKHSNHVSKCFSIRTFDANQFILKAQKQKDLERWLFVLTKMWTFVHTIQDRLMYCKQPTMPISPPPLLPPPPQNDTVDDNAPLVLSMNNTKPSNLSNEKIKVIEEWRKSLAELMANDPTIRITTPPPIEPIPDDDTMSIFTDMTSVSKRPKNNVKRRTSKRSSNRSLRRTKSNSISPSSKELPLEGRPTLKKKRSDDVRNWMNDKRKDKLSLIQIDPQQYDHCSTSPEIVQYMHFFQDALTVGEEEVPYEQHQNLKYHNSVRGRKLVQINASDNDTRRHSKIIEDDKGVHKEGDMDMYTGITRRASIPLMNQIHLNQQLLQKQMLQHQQLQQQQYLLDQQMSFVSPLQFLSDYNKVQEEEEEMSLADLQKSLRKISIQQPPYHIRSPSAPSIHDLHHHYAAYPSSIVAPAIPPHQYHRPASFYNDFNYPHQQFTANNNLLISSTSRTKKK